MSGIILPRMSNDQKHVLVDILLGHHVVGICLAWLQETHFGYGYVNTLRLSVRSIFVTWRYELVITLSSAVSGVHLVVLE